MGNPYETRRYVDEYLLFHYGRPRELCPYTFVPAGVLDFHRRLKEECLLPVRSRAGTSALDIGCAVGRFAFELRQVVGEVVGIDNSHAFIKTARRLAKRRTTSIRVLESGARYSRTKVSIPKRVRTDGVQFEVGDAMNLRRVLGSGAKFDIVAGINLLCRLPSPEKFLRQLPDLVKPGGQVILASPFSWLENFTEKKAWLEPADVIDALRPKFKLAQRRDIPFLIREHRRKFQLVISNVMTFRRVG
jgi:SAM-dependent methyltransferase